MAEKRKQWKPCTCPLKPAKLAYAQTWKHLLRVYQYERQAAILDIPNLDVQTDTDEETSEEDETPRQHVKKQKQQTELQKQQREQRQLETIQKTQQEKDEHLQMLESIHKTLQQYDKTPGYIRREISESQDMPEKLKKIRDRKNHGTTTTNTTSRTNGRPGMELRHTKCYRTYKEPRTMLSHLTTMHPQNIPHRNYNNAYTCPYCKQNYATIHMPIQHLEILNPKLRKC